MTKDDAIKILTQHDQTMRLLFTAVGLEAMAFANAGEQVEKTLGLGNALITELSKSLSLWTQGGSDYLAALENAKKGQLAPTAEDEWSEVISDN